MILLKDEVKDTRKFKGVQRKVSSDKRYVHYLARHRHNGNVWTSSPCNSRKEAALAYDKRLISLGLEPVNVLKRIQK